MSKQEKAAEYFNQGYACAQAVLLSLIDYTPLEKDTALNITSGFAGGGGNAKSICGAVTGAIMVIGMHEGKNYDVLMHKNSNIRLKCDNFIAEFSKSQKSIVCPVIIDQAKQQGIEQHKRCREAVAEAVKIVEKLMD